NCADGHLPFNQLILDTSGNLYGVTFQGGKSDKGTAFELTKKGKLITLYSFCRKTNCADGSTPSSGLTYDGAQNGTLYDGTSPLFGTTKFGGNPNAGTIYELTFVAATKPRAEDVIHVMCRKGGCPDGSDPEGHPTFDSNGNLFGFAASGGTHAG